MNRLRRLVARRFVPDGFAGRLALLLALALLAANAIALFVLSFERDRLGEEARLEAALERIVDAVPLLEDGGPMRRRAILRRLDRRGTAVALAARALVPSRAIEDRLQPMAARMAAALAAGDGAANGAERELRMAILRDPSLSDRAERRLERGRDSGRAGREGGERRSGRPSLALSIALDVSGAGPTWLNATLPPPRRGGGGVPPLPLLIGLSLAAVLGVALLYVRRATRPLRDLATAARAAGRGDRSARVAETGAREMREAAAAFNDMQARIARFDAERTRTLAAVGHDLRTPITSLRIRAEMLDDEQRDPMVRTLDEMRVMANGLVAFARGEGDAEASERIDLAAFLERLCRERGATFVASATNADLTASARPVAFARAIGNLIDNALRYAGAARVTLDREGNEAVIAVEDDGPGIPPDSIEAMLEPFTRGEASRSLDTGGAGLGLSIARAVVQAHGGTLRLANRPEGGLRAEARLPVVGRG